MTPENHSQPDGESIGRHAKPAQPPDAEPAGPAPAAAGRATAWAFDDVSSPVFKSFARSAASAASREIARSLFGGAARRGSS